jgi:hypothetical protein
LPLDQQQPLKKIVERVQGTSKKVEVTNRATKKEIQEAIKKADSTDIVVMFGHANPQGFETHGGLFRSSGTITTDELKGSFTSGATCVIGGCRSDSLAAAAAGGGARAAFGFSALGQKVWNPLEFKGLAEGIVLRGQSPFPEYESGREEARSRCPRTL